MDYYVYVIKSKKRNWLYVGMTNNITRRIQQHQKGESKSTAPYRPFCLLFTEKYPDSVSARNREKYLKAASGNIRKKYSISIDEC